MVKMQLIERCTDGCKHCQWMYGSPRCTHDAMAKRVIEDDPTDPCTYQKVPSDSRLFHKDCPITDYKWLTKNIRDDGCFGKYDCDGLFCKVCGVAVECFENTETAPTPHPS